MTIRPVAPDDSEAVVRCVREVYDEYGFTWDADGYHADLYNLAAARDESIGRYWVAELDGEVVGYGGIVWHEPVPVSEEPVVVDGYVRIPGTQGELSRFYVRQKGRRHGFAGRIVQNCIAAAKERGVTGIEIWSDKRFVDAHRLYQKAGAVKVAERTCDDPDLAPEWGFFLSASR